MYKVIATCTSCSVAAFTTSYVTESTFASIGYAGEISASILRKNANKPFLSQNVTVTLIGIACSSGIDSALGVPNTISLICAVGVPFDHFIKKSLSVRAGLFRLQGQYCLDN